MIQKVSAVNSHISFSQNKKDTNILQEAAKRHTPYVDSFVKNASESLPIMLAVTGGWTAYDVLSKKATLPKALVNNVFGFFAPVLVVSSAILSFVENKKTSKSSN